MKDPHEPQNGLCLLPSQRTDNHISFEDPLRASAGGASYLSHLQSWILDALTVFQMHVNVKQSELGGEDGDKGWNVLLRRDWREETGHQSAEVQQSSGTLTFEGLAVWERREWGCAIIAHTWSRHYLELGIISLGKLGTKHAYDVGPRRHAVVPFTARWLILGKRNCCSQHGEEAIKRVGPAGW